MHCVFTRDELGDCTVISRAYTIQWLLRSGHATQHDWLHTFNHLKVSLKSVHNEIIILFLCSKKDFLKIYDLKYYVIITMSIFCTTF